MRPEVREYNFDEMLCRALNVGSKTLKSTEKEINWIRDMVPYYDKVLGVWQREGELGRKYLELIYQYLTNVMTARESGKKLAMTSFCFCPAIFYAMDVVPVVLEPLTVLTTIVWKRGTTDYLDYGCELGFTETSCSAQRGALGAYLAGLTEEIDFVVCDSPGVCDTNANSFAFAAAYLNKPFYQLNYPPTLVDERSSAYHREDFKGMISFLESQTGKRLEQDRLREILEEYRKQDELIGELEEMQRFLPCPVPNLYNLVIYSGRFFFAGRPEYTEVLMEMVKQCELKAKQGVSGLHSGKEKVRALFCYIDHYVVNHEFWNWLDEHGVSELGSLLKGFFLPQSPYIKAGFQNASYEINTLTLDNMIDSVAQINSRMPMVNSIRGPYFEPYMWLEGTLQVAKILKADCVIYNATVGCRNTWGMVKPFMRDIEKHGYPTHIMYADGFDSRVEPWDATAARLEEFFKVRGLIK